MRTLDYNEANAMTMTGNVVQQKYAPDQSISTGSTTIPSLS